MSKKCNLCLYEKFIIFVKKNCVALTVKMNWRVHVPTENDMQPFKSIYIICRRKADIHQV